MKLKLSLKGGCMKMELKLSTRRECVKMKLKWSVIKLGYCGAAVVLEIR